ncbi:hypothetical protein ABH931_002953 [Streptacidiphilus sp. MAP12-33]|uniref:DUF3592 domain-containing protein n=1 Tax=Streptacidiphilus sp. MAP12-33 TaxID=3156266 RepID=UPI003519C715
MTTIEDRRPRPFSSRPESFLGVLRGGARAVQRLATPVVLAGLAAAAFAGWGSTVAHAGWTAAADAGTAGAGAGLLRVVLGARPPGPGGPGQRGGMLASLLSRVLLWSLAGVFAFSLSYFFQAHALDRRATLTVTATVTNCEARGDAGNLCTYRWSDGGHRYSSRDAASEAWPDGHRTAVRIDPGHPGRPARITSGYWALWIGVAVGLLGTPLAGLMVWVTDENLEDL